MENTTATHLTFKEAVAKILNYSRIEAKRNHDKIQQLVDDLTNDTTITYGTVIADFDSDVVVSYATANNLTYTTSTKLTTSKATELSINLSRAQAKKDHDSLNDAIDVTDEWIKEQFDEEVVQIYVDTFEENFKVKPEMILEIFQSDETLGSTFEGYSTALNENNINLTKDEATTYTFEIDEKALSAIGTIGEEIYKVDYKTKSTIKVEN